MNAIPPPKGVANQPGCRASQRRSQRASATFATRGCEVKTNGGTPRDQLRRRAARRVRRAAAIHDLQGHEPDQAGGRREDRRRFGRLQVRSRAQGASDPAGIAGRVARRRQQLAGVPPRRRAATPTPFRCARSNRLVVAESAGGSIAAFPPPHNFFWSREVAYNLGYVWYRKDSDSTPIRSASGSPTPRRTPKRWAAARKTRGRTSRCAARGPARGSACRFTCTSAPRPPTAPRAARLRSRATIASRRCPGYQVMATHFHTAMVGRLRRLGGLDVRLPDFDVMKAAGVNIFAPIDGSGLGFGLPREDRLKTLADYYEAARRHSDKNFLIMPNEEGAAGGLGGHNDLLDLEAGLLAAGPATPDSRFVEDHPTYGKVYNIGSPDRHDGDGAAREPARSSCRIRVRRDRPATRTPSRTALLPRRATIAASACAGAWGSTAPSSASARSAARRSGTR